MGGGWRVAAREGLRFLVIGGHGVAFHGFLRGTEDADILVSRSEGAGWCRVATRIGYRLVHEGESFLQFQAPTADDWNLDLTMVSPQTFEELFSASLAKAEGREGAG